MPDLNRPLSEGKIAALKRLKLAYDDAEDLRKDPCQLAVSDRELIAASAAASDLTWLIELHYVDHLYDITPPGRSPRQFRAADGAPLRDNSCFALSYSGKVYAERNLRCGAAVKKGALADVADPKRSDAAAPDGGPTGRAVPRWRGAASTGSTPQRSDGADASSEDRQSGVPPLPVWRAVAGELYFRGGLARRRGRKSAKLEEFLLAMFSAADWERSLPVRFPSGPIKGRKQLKEAVRRLNKHMLADTLRFHVHHDGRIVCWEDRVIKDT